MLTACVGTLVLAAAGGAFGATQSVKDGRVHVSGTIATADVSMFMALLDTDPQPTTVVFEQCLGGTLSAAYSYSKAIRQRQLRTVARRQVSSACAIAFLGGVKRGLDDGVGTTVIGLHVGRRADGLGPSSEPINMGLLSFIAELAGGRIGERVQGLIARSWSEAAGVYFVSSNYLLFRINKTVYCDGTQGRDTAKCLRLDGVDAYSQGIVTER